MKISFSAKDGAKPVGGCHIHCYLTEAVQDYFCESDGNGYGEVHISESMAGLGVKIYMDHPGYTMPTIYLTLPHSDLEVPLPLVPFAGGEPVTPIAWPVHRDGLVIREFDGTIFRWLGLTAFQLYKFWLEGREDEIDAAVNDWTRTVPGATVVRVLGMVNSFAHLWPQEWPDYYAQLKPFCAYILENWGLGVEFTVFADAAFIMPDRGERDRHARRVRDALEDVPNVFWESANEPQKTDWNLPGGDEEAKQHAVMASGHGFLCTSGATSEEAIAAGYAGPDYAGIHPPRDDQWYRRMKDVLDVRDQTGLPCCADEPIGIAETDKPGSRTTNADECGTAAAIAQMMGLGSTIHGDFGITCTPMGPVQRECASRWNAAATWVPVEAQLARFTRGRGILPDGSIAPPCDWTYAPGEAPAPAHHADAIDLRSYAKSGPFGTYLVQCHVPGQPYRPQVVPCAGWVVDQDGPSVGLATMRQG